MNGFGQHADSEVAGDLAGLDAAHAIGHGEQNRPRRARSGRSSDLDRASPILVLGAHHARASGPAQLDV